MLGTGCYYFYDNNNRGSRRKGQGRLKGGQAKDIGSGRAWTHCRVSSGDGWGRGAGQVGATVIPFFWMRNQMVWKSSVTFQGMCGLP